MIGILWCLGVFSVRSHSTWVCTDCGCTMERTRVLAFGEKASIWKRERVSATDCSRFLGDVYGENACGHTWILESCLADTGCYVAAGLSSEPARQAWPSSLADALRRLSQDHRDDVRAVIALSLDPRLCGRLFETHARPLQPPAQGLRGSLWRNMEGLSGYHDDRRGLEAEFADMIARLDKIVIWEAVVRDVLGSRKR